MIKVLLSYFIGSDVILLFVCVVGFRFVLRNNWHGWQLNGTILLFLGRMPLIILTINDVPRSTENTKLLTIPKMALVLLSTIRSGNTILPTASTFWLAALSSRGISQGRIDGSQSGSTRSFCIRLGPTPMSKIHWIGLIHDAVKRKLMKTL